MEKKEEKMTPNLGVKSFMTAIVVIFIMMVLTYSLTFIIPGGGIPFWKWAFSPILVLFGEDNSSLISVIALLVVLGGVFNCLDKFGVLKFLLDRITEKFGKKRRVLPAVTTLFFMALGSVAGTYEECVALVPVVVALAVRLGWDALTGLGMSILAAGCGFAAGVCNPFTIGVAQELVGLPVFSGLWLRVVSFVLIYLLLIGFLFWHIKRIEKPMEKAELSKAAKYDEMAEIKETSKYDETTEIKEASKYDETTEIKETSKYDETTEIKEASKYDETAEIKETSYGNKIKRLIVTFMDGVISVLPGVFLILMANSIRFTMMEGKILEPILQGAIAIAEGLPRWSVILFIYALVLFLNFFLPSGSAKAFLLMPLIVPVAQVFDISAQLCIMAFAFGDGFSNVFYPTNPVLLISLGFAGVSYGDWVKWSAKFQLANILLTCLLLLFGLAVGYY